MKSIFFICILLSVPHLLFSQNTGIGTPTPAAKLEIKGSGTTSATTSLQVIDNSNTPLFNVKDNGEVNVLSGSFFVNGNINFSGPLQISGSSGNSGQVLTSNGSSAPAWQTIAQNPSVGFTARLSASVAVSNFTYTTLTNFTETTDDGNGFNGATGGFTAPSAGMYHFDVAINWGASPVASNVPATIRIYKGASIAEGGQLSYRINTDGTYGSGQPMSINLKLLAGETVSIQVQQINGGAALNVSGGGGSGHSSFSGYKVY